MSEIGKIMKNGLSRRGALKGLFGAAIAPAALPSGGGGLTAAASGLAAPVPMGASAEAGWQVSHNLINALTRRRLVKRDKANPNYAMIDLDVRSLKSVSPAAKAIIQQARDDEEANYWLEVLDDPEQCMELEWQSIRSRIKYHAHSLRGWVE